MSLQQGGERATVMITVKASPEIGRTHGETVCVAGIRLDLDAPRWIRLFPVQWQWFWQGGHPKFQVIDLNVRKHEGDQRPESHRPNLDTPSIVREKSTVAQRSEVLNSLRNTRCVISLRRRGGGVRRLGSSFRGRSTTSPGMIKVPIRRS